MNNKLGNLLISTELKKKETYVVLAFPCELDGNVFKWVVEIKGKNEAKDVLDSSSSFRLKTPSTQAVKEWMIMLKTVQ